MNKKYIIFGATGSIGSSLAHKMYEEKKDCHLVGRNSEELENKFYSQLPFCEINQVMNFVNEKTNFLSALKPIQDRYHKEDTISNARVIAAILSKALNYGDYKMSQASDISYQELKTVLSQQMKNRKKRDMMKEKII